MNGTPVQLTDMLLRREQRAAMQNMLLEKYHHPVISFCMNIPGPVKTNDLIRKAFDDGLLELKRTLTDTQIQILETLEIHEPTGDELLMSVALPAEQLKDITTKIEETHPLGRLFDMDVLDEHGSKLSRPSYRKCLICDKQAQECARMRTHSVAEMQEVIERMLWAYLATLTD